MADSSEIPGAGTGTGTDPSKTDASTGNTKVSIGDGSFVRTVLEGFYETSTAQAIIVMDAQGIVQGWANASEELLGYTAEEAIGKPLSDIFTPHDLSQKIDVYEFEVARADGFAEDDRWHMRKDGSRVWVTGTLSAVRGPDGTVLGFVKIMRDRTDLRGKMEFIDISNAREREQARRTELFLGTLGHELRNPLGTLTLVSQLMEARDKSDELARDVEVMKRQLAVLNGLAGDLMDVARGRHDGFDLSLGRVHLQQLLSEAISDLKVTAKQKNVSLTPLLQQGPIYIQADARRMTQAIVNLVGNALKYTQAGGEVFLKLVEEVDEIVIRVEDTGLGISGEMLPRIFEFFTQDPEARKMAPGGLGVGLGLVRQIIEAHGGTVAARSPGAGKGSEFTVRLPFPSEKNAAA